MAHPLPLYAPTDGVGPASRAGSPFDALVREHYARLCNFAYRLVRSRAAAEDVVQEVLVRVWEREHEFDFRDPLPFLYRAVRNGAVSHLRREKVRERWQASALDGERHAPRADAIAADADDLGAAIAAAVDALPERCRLVFTMSREQELSYAEIARSLGISVKTVETQMGRALRTLRTRLAPYLSVGLVLAAAGWTHRLLR